MLFPAPGGYANTTRGATSLYSMQMQEDINVNQNFRSLWNISRCTYTYNYHTKKIVSAHYHANTSYFFHLINIIRRALSSECRIMQISNLYALSISKQPDMETSALQLRNHYWMIGQFFSPLASIIFSQQNVAMCVATSQTGHPCK